MGCGVTAGSALPGRQAARTSDMREVKNAILYIAGGGIAWRMLLKDFPPVSTVWGFFYRWRYDGTLALMNFALVQAAREVEGKEPCPQHQPEGKTIKGLHNPASDKRSCDGPQPEGEDQPARGCGHILC